MRRGVASPRVSNTAHTAYDTVSSVIFNNMSCGAQNMFTLVYWLTDFVSAYPISTGKLLAMKWPLMKEIKVFCGELVMRV